VATRWASFDCYGTLIDWNAGIRTEFVRIFGEPNADRLLSRYHEARAPDAGEPPDAALP
jgi:FMN phosphatase YigB (HAD superfamily)